LALVKGIDNTPSFINYYLRDLALGADLAEAELSGSKADPAVDANPVVEDAVGASSKKDHLLI